MPDRARSRSPFRKNTNNGFSALEEVIDRFKTLLEETSLQNLTALRRSLKTLQTQLERKAVSRVSSVLTRMTD